MGQKNRGMSRLLRPGDGERDGAGFEKRQRTDYDGAGRPVRWTYRKGSQSGNDAMIGFRYTYDRTGNKLAQRSLHDSRDSQRYAYDSANRLTSYSRGAFDASEPTLLSASWCDTATTPAWPGMVQGARMRHKHFVSGRNSMKALLIVTTIILLAVVTEGRVFASDTEWNVPAYTYPNRSTISVLLILKHSSGGSTVQTVKNQLGNVAGISGELHYDPNIYSCPGSNQEVTPQRM